MTAVSQETRTIPDMLAEAPDVDVRETWAAYWDILTEARDKVMAALPVEPHPSTAGLAHHSNADGTFEGSLNAYTGPQVDWLVHSWIGNRQRSILDMNLTVFLGQHIDVPHLVIVLGTVPLAYHYTDLQARRDLTTDIDYLQRYYEPANEAYIAFRSDPRFTWSMSHGTYMRAITSPVCHSFMAERTPEIVDVMRAHVTERVDRWLSYVADAQPVPEEQRAALRRRDHLLRRNAYRLDPMNKLAEGFLGAERVEELVSIRAGEALLDRSVLSEGDLA